MKRIMSLLVGLSMFGAISNAQNNAEFPLDLLVAQCRQVIELNDSIIARQSEIRELEGKIEELKSSWTQICQEAVRNPGCDIVQLIEQTDPVLEAELLAQLKQIKPTKGEPVIKPESGKSSPSEPKKSGNPDKSHDAAAPAKEEKNDADVRTDAKEPSEKSEQKSESLHKKGQVPELPVKKEEPEANDSRKEEETATKTKDETNRDKTIYTIKNKHKIKNP